jgi:glycosyltransferase involved in cell wall biosynthesis
MRGGAARSLLEMLSRLPRRQWSPTVIVPREGEFSRECDTLGINCRFVPSVWWVAAESMDQWLYGMNRLPAAVEAVRTIIRQERIDVVHSNSSVNPVGALAAATECVPHVWHVREFLSKENLALRSYPLDFGLVRNTIRALSSRIIVISESLADEYADNSEDGKVEVVYDGVDSQKFGGIARSKNSVILSIGATTADKGLDDLMDAASKLQKNGITAEFVVLGHIEPRDYFNRVTDKLRNLGLSDSFRLEGFCSDIRPHLANAGLFCLPSRAEGMSRTVLEAMAAGLPVVATDCGGPGELITDGQTGLLCPPSDPGALADALSTLITDADFADRLGASARETVRDKFDVRAAVERTVKIIESASEAAEIYIDPSAIRLFLFYLEQAGPRVLLGKKWRMMKPVLGLK